MKQGFVDPPLFKHFPSSFDEASLSSSAYTRSPPPTYNLTNTLADTLDKLSGTNPTSPAFISPPTPRQAVVDDSMDSMDVSLSLMESPSRQSEHSIASSQGTVEQKRPQTEEDPRDPVSEPLVWAKELAKACRGLFKHSCKASPSRAVRIAQFDSGGETLFAKKEVEGYTWIASTPSPSSNNVLLLGLVSGDDVPQISIGAFRLEDSMRCVALEFFDEEELLLVIQRDGEMSLSTFRYADYALSLRPIPAGMGETSSMNEIAKFIESEPSVSRVIRERLRECPDFRQLPTYPCLGNSRCRWPWATYRLDCRSMGVPGGASPVCPGVQGGMYSSMTWKAKKQKKGRKARER